jgi:hypothetical protein
MGERCAGLSLWVRADDELCALAMRRVTEVMNTGRVTFLILRIFIPLMGIIPVAIKGCVY